MSKLSVKIVSDDGAKFQSSGETSERVSFAVWLLTTRGEQEREHTNEHAAAFESAAIDLLNAAEAYYNFLNGQRKAK